MASRALTRNAIPGSNRWGMISRPLNISLQVEQTPLLAWDDLDHSRSLHLGLSGSSSIVFQKSSANYFALRFCNEADFSYERSQLVQMGRLGDTASTGLLTTRCIFNYDGKRYVGSALSDMSLADIIDCTIPLQELHLSTILNQVASAIHDIHQKSATAGKPLIYGNLCAANVFVGRDGSVKLAFGRKVAPEKLTKENRHQDRFRIGALTSHLISRNAEEPTNIVLQQKMISLRSIGKRVDMKFQPSPQLVDFWELCFLESCGMERILNHPFLKEGHREALTALVVNAERSASRPCFSAIEEVY